MLTPGAGPSCAGVFALLGNKVAERCCCLQDGVPGVRTQYICFPACLAVSSWEMANSSGPAWGWEDPPTLGDLSPAESVPTELVVEERRVLNSQRVFLSWLRSVLGLCCLGGCQNLVGLQKPVHNDLFSYWDFRRGVGHGFMGTWSGGAGYGKSL